MIEYICDRIAEVNDIETIHVVTNARFASGFKQWAKTFAGAKPVRIHDDGTQSNEDRLGALGDIRFTIEQASVADEDILIIAGDNLFDFSLVDYVTYFRNKGDGSTLAVYECPDMELVKQYSTVEVDANGRITAFIEKPPQPTTNLVGTAAYIYHKEHVPLLFEYLDTGNKPDQPGNFLAWLYPKAPIYAYPFDGKWLDIGNLNELHTADNMMRDRNGLPLRDSYAID
jgi:glucose-1-phosphate thymidylyltransferase